MCAQWRDEREKLFQTKALHYSLLLLLLLLLQYTIIIIFGIAQRLFTEQGRAEQ